MEGTHEPPVVEGTREPRQRGRLSEDPARCLKQDVTPLQLRTL